jgi:hypothetical protein
MAHHHPRQQAAHRPPAALRPKSRPFVIVLVAVTAMLAGIEAVHADTSPVPLIVQWESNMISYGRQHCNELQPGGAPDNYQLEYTYYDAESVYYQIMKYTGDPTWKYCAGLAQGLYRDKIVLPQNGKIPGYWSFTKGLLLDWQRTKDPLDYTAVNDIIWNAAFHGETPLEWTASIDSSREVAYAIMNYLNAETMGMPRRTRLADMVNQALGHIDQWFVTKTAQYMRPFMVAITCKALIQYYDVTHDSRIPPAVKKAIDGVWAQAWMAQQQTFQYTNVDTRNISAASMGYNTGSTDPSPDLNLMIAPVYAWWYMQSGDTTYRDKADQIFAGGITKGGPSLYYAKQFNQNYWWSFEYLNYRRLAQPGTTPGSTVGPGVETTSTTPSTTPSTSVPSAPTTAPSTGSISQSLTAAPSTAPTPPSTTSTPSTSPSVKPPTAQSTTTPTSTTPVTSPAPKVTPAAAASPSQSLTGSSAASLSTAAPASTNQQTTAPKKQTLKEAFVGKLKKFMEMVK